VQLRAHLFEHLIGVGHRIRAHDPVQGQQQTHHRVINEFEQHRTGRIIRAQCPHNCDQAFAMDGLDGSLEILGHLPGCGVQIVQRGDGVVDSFGQRLECRFCRGWFGGGRPLSCG
jgi:hypothetical protein